MTRIEITLEKLPAAIGSRSVRHEPLMPVASAVTLMALAAQEGEDNKETPAAQAVLYRDTLILALYQSFPLPPEIFAALSFDDNLFTDREGKWHLRFQKNEIDFPGMLRSDYQTLIPEALAAWINRYRKEFHPHLDTSSDKSRVFLKTKPASATAHQTDARLDGGDIADILKQRTEEFIHSCMGLTPLDFENLLVQHLFSNAPPEGWAAAAAYYLHRHISEIEAAYQSSFLAFNKTAAEMNLFDKIWKSEVPHFREA